MTKKYGEHSEDRIDGAKVLRTSFADLKNEMKLYGGSSREAEIAAEKIETAEMWAIKAAYVEANNQ